MKNVPVLISLYTIYSRRKGRNVEIVNTTRMVIVFLISTFLLPFLHFGKLRSQAICHCERTVKYFREMVREENENKSIHTDA